MLEIVGMSAVGTAGQMETIRITPGRVVITDARYATNVTVAPDGQSISFRVAASLNNLVINYMSASMHTVHITFLSGPNPLRFATASSGAGNCVIPIQGQ